MGIKGLTAWVNEHTGSVSNLCVLKSPTLLLDGLGLAHHLLTTCHRARHGDYAAYDAAARHFFRALLATHVSGKFASVLGRVARVAVAQGSQAGPDGAPWSSGGLDGKKNTLGDHEWGLFAVLDDGSGVEFSYKKLKWPGS